MNRSSSNKIEAGVVAAGTGTMTKAKVWTGTEKSKEAEHW
jgi:hypothetical protein